jgi:hypothetical protein
MFFLLQVGEDAGSCLRVISNEGNRYNRALMGYVLQPNCRVLLVTDGVGRVMARSVVRLLVRSDTREPIIFADPMFFTLGFSYELQAELLYQARLLQEHMQVWRAPPPTSAQRHNPTAPLPNIFGDLMLYQARLMQGPDPSPSPPPPKGQPPRRRPRFSKA